MATRYTSTSPYTDRWQVIGRGFAGWHAQGSGRLSGAACGERLARSAVDGALVYDASGADAEAFSRLVISGPMCSAELPPYDSDKFGDSQRAALRSMRPGLTGAFAELADIAEHTQFSSLDSVGVGIYEQLLREVPGIRIGKVRAGRIEWEEVR